MSFSRLNYDSCAYDQNIKESISPGDYQLNVPKVPKGCFVASPYIRLEKDQVSTFKDTSLIDVDSELLGLNRSASKCMNSEMPNKNLVNRNTCKQSILECEDTKLSNPACTLRGTGFNRWEYLCSDPQEKAEIPFMVNLSDKTIAKDNHRAILPKVYDVTNEVSSMDTCLTDNGHLQTIIDQAPSSSQMHWRSCEEIRRL